MSPSDIADSQEPLAAAGVLGKRLLVSAGLVLLITAGLICPFPTDGRLWSAVFDLAHAPVFCGLVLVVVGSLDPAAVGLSAKYPTLIRMGAGRILSVAGLIMTLGLACEYLQRYAGRSSNFHDVVANTVGIVVALLWIHAVQRSARRLVCLFVAALLVTAVSVTPAPEVWDSMQQLWSFPQLASFERRWELTGWQTRSAKIEYTDEWSTDGSFAMKVRLQPHEYPGVTLHFLRKDWRAFDVLRLDLKNPQKTPISLTLRLNDRAHIDNDFPDDDRFEQALEIPPGEHLEVSIDLDTVTEAPADRRMQLEAMAMLIMFAVEPEEPVVFMVDHVRLESFADTE